MYVITTRISGSNFKSSHSWTFTQVCGCPRIPTDPQGPYSKSPLFSPSYQYCTRGLKCTFVASLLEDHVILFTPLLKQDLLATSARLWKQARSPWMGNSGVLHVWSSSWGKAGVLQVLHVDIALALPIFHTLPRSIVKRRQGPAPRASASRQSLSTC